MTLRCSKNSKVDVRREGERPTLIRLRAGTDSDASGTDVTSRTFHWTSSRGRTSCATTWSTTRFRSRTPSLKPIKSADYTARRAPRRPCSCDDKSCPEVSAVHLKHLPRPSFLFSVLPYIFYEFRKDASPRPPLFIARHELFNGSA